MTIEPNAVEAAPTGLLPLRTQRLLLRVVRPIDAAAIVEMRNHPDVARYQDWALPYTGADVERLLAACDGLDDVRVDEWTQVAILLDDRFVGDLAVHLGRDGAVAMVGYSLRHEWWGKGIAREAVGALVDALFARGVRRIVATLDPENVASMRVLEHLGFVHEGTARRAEPIRGEWLDDMRFALLSEERAEWLARPTSFQQVRLVELTPTTVRSYGRLATHPSQQRFVAPMWASFGDALFPEEIDGAPVLPWMRGIEADGIAVGFMMIAAVTDAHPEPYLWRLLVDRRYQRSGVGALAVAQLVDLLRAEGHRRLLVSWVDGPGGPRRFYERLGFTPTGTVLDGEIEGALDL